VLKISAVLEQFATGICRLQHYPAGSRHAILVARVVSAWAEGFGIITDKPDLTAKQREFLQVFDLAYRRRRLSFLIEYINRLYPPSEIADLPAREQVDKTKQELYALMAELQLVRPGKSLDEKTLQQLNQVFGKGIIEADDAIEKADSESNGGPNLRAQRRVDAAGRLRMGPALSAFLQAHDGTLTVIFQELHKELRDQLKTFNDRQAKDLARLAGWNWPKPIIGDLLARYVGFAYWDLLLYPIQALSEVAELNTIEVTRISPEDTEALKPLGTTRRLEGVRLFDFGAFLCRSYRENDFLWGRFDGVERLFSILADVSRKNGVVLDKRLMWQGFEAVLDSEAPDLKCRASKKLIANLRDQVKKGLAGTADQPPGPPPSPKLAEAAD
jgi:hypothetical protein